MNTYFIVRDTEHPQEDLNRNWSSFTGGSCIGELPGKTKQEAKLNYATHIGIEPGEVTYEFRFHPAYNAFVMVHYQGLGAFLLAANKLQEAIKEATEYEAGLAVTMQSGNGHFYAANVVSFHKVSQGRYIFELRE